MEGKGALVHAINAQKGQQRYSSSHTYPPRWIVASGRIYILAVLFQKKKTHRTLKIDVRWAERPVRTFWIREQFLTLGVQHVAQSMHRHTEYGIAVCRLST